MTVQQARTCGFKGIGFSRSGLIVHVDMRLIRSTFPDAGRREHRSGGATIHHLAGTRSGPLHPAQERPPWPESADHKLRPRPRDASPTSVSTSASIAERQTALSDQTASHAKDLGDLMTKHRETMRAGARRRSVAWPAKRRCSSGAGTLVALAVGLVQPFTHVHLS